jgi:hypothetical protein
VTGEKLCRDGNGISLSFSVVDIASSFKMQILVREGVADHSIPASRRA